MARTTVEIDICDICGRDTEGFYYYEEVATPFGVRSEDRLRIDICESCCKEIYYDIPRFMFYERYDNLSENDTTQMKIEEQVKKWRAII